MNQSVNSGGRWKPEYEALVGTLAVAPTPQPITNPRIEVATNIPKVRVMIAAIEISLAIPSR